ncbi:MAG: CHAD domain-containing protein [Anaerolineae bacterium]|nr:CHAD domain-containing protein [Anaerolineae bacterium]
MALTTLERIEALEAAQQPVQPEDTMAEAGRKALLGEFVRMLKHEDGSRSGEDIEDVHQMRVAIRRMRSLLRLLEPYLKRGDTRSFQRDLKRIGTTLGEVRDLDVLLEDLHVYQLTLEADQQADMQTVIDGLDANRVSAREDLLDELDAKFYRRFVRDFADFLLTPGSGVKPLDGDGVVPTQIRHILPTLIYDRLASVRAYETVIDGADPTTLHALRIEFKRLRYTVSLFESILGSQIDEFIDELKAIQDCLGHMNDAAAARIWLDAYKNDPVQAYIAQLEERDAALRLQFMEIWMRFNTRKVQQKLSAAVLALR